MTRGTLGIFTEDGIYTTTEYNGDMYPEGNGGVAYQLLERVETVKQLANAARKINKEYHYPEGDNVYLAAVAGTEEYKKYLDLCIDPGTPFENGYFQTWFSDYLYLKNLCKEPIEVKCMDLDEREQAKVVRLKLEPQRVYCFHYGRVIRDVKERIPDYEPPKFDVVLKETPLDDGLAFSDVNRMFKSLNCQKAIPIEFQAENSSAMGFIDLHTAELIDYDYSLIEDRVVEILNDMGKESEDGSYICDVPGCDVFGIQIIR